MSQTYYVRTGQKCNACFKDYWLSVSGHLRCDCGRKMWIVRHSNIEGTHFSYKQGSDLPKTFQGWLEETK
jgi:hypothetical protein